MAFSLQNITATENVISSLSDRPQMNSSALKDKFDQMGEQIKAQVNERIVSAVNGAIATSVTATDEKIPTSNAVKTYVDAQIIEAGAGDMTKANYDSTNTGNKVDKAIVAEGLTSDALASIKLAMYPIGAVYTSVLATDPSTLFGGTWQRIGEGQILVGVNSQDSDFNSAEKTGGAKTVTLSSSQMPAHYHGISASTGTESTAHTHSVSVDIATMAHQHQIPQLARQEGYGLANTASWTSNLFLTGSDRTYGTQWANTDHNHSASAGTESSLHSHTLEANTYSVGGGSAHNNMPPYYTVYMWKRVS